MRSPVNAKNGPAGKRTSEQPVRPCYAPCDVVSAADLSAGQDYLRAVLRQHNREQHGYGVACGLEVLPGPADEESGLPTVTVTGGYALSPQGDEIFVPDAQTALVDCLPTRDECKEGEMPPSRPVYLAIRYAERTVCPTSIYPERCAPLPQCEDSRIQAGFQIACLTERPPVPPQPDCQALLADLFRGMLPQSQAAPPAASFCAPAETTPWVILAGLALDSATNRVEVDYAVRSRLFSAQFLYDVLRCLPRPLPPPAITAITPDVGQQGTSQVSIIQGRSLAGATAITFSGSGVSGRVLRSSDDEVEVDITISTNAALGNRTFQVTTPQGTADSAEVSFRVAVGAPAITGISTASGRQGTLVRAVIIGRHFGRILSGATVVFSGSGVTARIMPGASDTTVPIEIQIAPNAPLGARTFAITGPRGQVASGATTFTVTPAPRITSIQPAQSLRGRTIDAVITGQGLTAATAVTFSGQGVTARMRFGGNDNRVLIRITLASDAPLGDRTFQVRTATATVNSGSVTFRVLGFSLPTVRIDSMEPGIQLQGTTVTHTIQGQGLSRILQLTFANAGINAQVLSSSDQQISVRISVQRGVSVSQHPFHITVPGRTVDSADFNVFLNVLRLPPRPPAVDEITGIGPVRSARLESSGVSNATDLVTMEPTRLADILGVSEEMARRFVAAARSMLE